ncbi:MAG: zincin-like metallopeptidase domain-containing protein [Planctomycetota bacterium]
MSPVPDLYQSVTDQIIAALESGTVPWRHPILGSGEDAMPRNLNTGRPYAGINIFTLGLTAWTKGYASPWWLTYRQTLERGGHVRKGEKSSVVVFWKQLTVKDEETGKPKLVPMLKSYRVFNAEQCEGVAYPALEVSEKPFKPDERAEALVKGFTDGPVIEHRGNQAYYRPADDVVRLPGGERFVTGEDYYATLFHELVHATGHSSRLDRGLDTKLASFGSADYSKEELTAEMGAACLCALAGIVPATLDQHAAYIAEWLKRLRNDKRLVVSAAGAGQKAADWVRGIRHSREEKAR